LIHSGGVGTRIAAVQFPVSGNLARNLMHIRRQVTAAAHRGARVVHLPETALPGYPPRHHTSLRQFPWDELTRSTDDVRRLAEQLGVWVVLGTMRKVAGELPRNSTLLIAPDGGLQATYDKRRLYAAETAFFSAGQAPCVVSIEGITAGLLICYENCFPALYEQYRQMGTSLIFHSFFNAGNTGPTSIRHLMRASLLVRAADHGLCINASNSSERYAPLAACIVRPDGSSTCAKRHVSGAAIDHHPPTSLGWTYPRA
jgi:deaminated glutathione amidase